MTTRPVLLEAAGPEDAAALAPLHASAFEAPWSAAELATTMAGPSRFAIKAFCVDVLVGFVVAHAAAGEAEILTLAVEPSRRRGGVGRALVDAAAALAAAAGADAMWLEVAEDNAGARALYAETGFEPVGYRRGYYSRPAGAVDALVLRRRLNSAAA